MESSNSSVIKDRVVLVKSPFKRLSYNHHSVHNPNCDILEGHLNDDSMLTYGKYVSGPDKGKAFVEYYSGENYCVKSKLRSYSRCWHSLDRVPKKYKQLIIILQTIHETLPH